MKLRKRILCVDFDGVIHSYKSGWCGMDFIPDPPVPGALEWIEEIIREGFAEIAIYSARSKSPEGLNAMKEWFREYAPDLVRELSFPTEKPAAFLTIDDRAICFQGTFPTPDEMAAFTPWHQRPHGAKD